MSTASKDKWCGQAKLGILVWPILGLLVVVGGCGDGRPPTYPTEGKLLIHGKGYKGVHIVLVPVDGPKEKVPSPTAMTNADGSFKLTTYKAYDGAPAGEYRVQVTYDPVPSPFAKKLPKPPPFDAKYGKKEESPLRVTIEAKDGNVLNLKIPE